MISRWSSLTSKLKGFVNRNGSKSSSPINRETTPDFSENSSIMLEPQLSELTVMEAESPVVVTPVNAENSADLAPSSVESNSEETPTSQIPASENFYQVRREIAARYIAGEGIEIGALHAPLEVPDHVQVRYLDRLSVEGLRKQYPELADFNLVTVDIIDDGETLNSIPDASLDFVIANHMIEHCQDPIGSLKNYLRVLKSGGILYMAVPDKRYTFDCDRPVTSLDHLIRDYTEGAEWSKRTHFEEYIRLVAKMKEKNVAIHAQALMDMDYSIHFHVWTTKEFLEFLLYCQSILSFSFELERFQKNEVELIFILKKVS